MHRYCRNFTDDEEEYKRQGTPTPSAREAWKQRRKKMELQQSYSHRTSDDPPDVRQCTLQWPDDWRDTGRPTVSSDRMTDTDRKSGATGPEKKRRTSDARRTSGPSRATGRPTPTGRPVTACVQPRPFGLVSLSHLPLRGLDYINSFPTSFLGLANMIAHL
jgi:hypothetical protein